MLRLHDLLTLDVDIRRQIIRTCYHHRIHQQYPPSFCPLIPGSQTWCIRGPHNAVKPKDVPLSPATRVRAYRYYRQAILCRPEEDELLHIFLSLRVQQIVQLLVKFWGVLRYSSYERDVRHQWLSSAIRMQTNWRDRVGKDSLEHPRHPVFVLV